jgi:hypothetical protein
MKRWIITIVVTFIFWRTDPAQAGGVVDPVADFISKNEIGANDELWVLKCDLDHDGQFDYLLSVHYNEKGVMAMSNGIWSLYLRRGDRYALALEKRPDGTFFENGITIDPNYYSVGTIPEVGKWGLQTAWILKGRNGGVQLRAIVVEGDSFSIVNVGPVVDDPTKNILGRFPNPPTPAISKKKVHAGKPQ